MLQFNRSSLDISKYNTMKITFTRDTMEMQSYHFSTNDVDGGSRRHRIGKEDINIDEAEESRLSKLCLVAMSSKT